MDIKDKIYNLRKKSGLSQEDLGFKLGVSKHMLVEFLSNLLYPVDKVMSVNTQFANKQTPCRAEYKC